MLQQFHAHSPFMIVSGISQDDGGAIVCLPLFVQARAGGKSWGGIVGG
jgi:hypothetical protein